LPDIRSSNQQTRSYAERQAVNSLIQGSAGDIMKLAMIRLRKLIATATTADQDTTTADPTDSKTDTRLVDFTGVHMVLQVHDEVVLEVPITAVHAVASSAQRSMEAVECGLNMRFPVSVSIGPSLGELTRVSL
jgi:DNA polymerase-1